MCKGKRPSWSRTLAARRSENNNRTQSPFGTMHCPTARWSGVWPSLSNPIRGEGGIWSPSSSSSPRFLSRKQHLVPQQLSLSQIAVLTIRNRRFFLPYSFLGLYLPWSKSLSINLRVSQSSFRMVSCHPSSSQPAIPSYSSASSAKSKRWRSCCFCCCFFSFFELW